MTRYPGEPLRAFVRVNRPAPPPRPLVAPRRPLARAPRARRVRSGRSSSRGSPGRSSDDDPAPPSGGYFSRVTATKPRYAASSRSTPLTRAREYDGELLDGVTLHAANLSDDELRELRALLRGRQEAARRGEAWPAAERERVEAIVSKAAGEPDVYARRRDELRRADEMRAEATKLARVFLPRRREPEPGSVELPGVLWSWLTNGQADTFDVTDLGVLAALAFSFANESAELFPRGSFVHDERGPGIALGKVAGQPRLARGADDSERLLLGERLAILKANRWLELDRDRGGRLTIRQGERMRKLWKE